MYRKREDECTEKVYGFKPVSFITIIVVIAGVMSALLMPIIGAIIDYTPHRKTAGVFSAGIMIMIQAAQIGTVARTWFPMAILQVIAGFLYHMQTLSVFSYLPELASNVGQKTMASRKFLEGIQ